MTPQLIKSQSHLVQAGSIAGTVGPALFAVTFILQNILRTDDDAIAEPVSALSIGDYGWVQRLNFVVLGVLLLVFAAALHRGVASAPLGWLGPALVSMAGVGLFVAAAFSLTRNQAGSVHDPGFHQAGGIMFLGGTAFGLIALSLRLARDPRWQDLSRYTLGAGIAATGGGVVLNALAIPDDASLHGVLGLVQRLILLVVIFPMLITLGHRLRGLTTTPERPTVV